MKTSYLLVLAIVIVIGCTTNEKKTAFPPPPPTPVRTVVDEFHGVKVPDDYQYLEALKDDSVLHWFKKQDDYARNILSRISVREDLLKRIKELDETVAQVNAIQLSKDRIFYIKKEPDQQSGNLFYRKGLDGKETLLIDVTKIGGDDKRVYTINNYYPSPDGKLLAFTSSPSGSEDDVTYLVDVETGKLLPDRLVKSGFTLSWLPDSKSFFYLRLKTLGEDEAESEKYLDSKSFLHTVGTPQENDREIISAAKYGNLGMDRIDFPMVFSDKKSNTAFVLIARGVQNEINVLSASLPDTKRESVIWRKVIDVKDEITNFATVNGSNLIALTHKNAPNFKLVKTSTSNPDFSKAELLIGFDDQVIQNFAVAKNSIIVQTLKDGIGKIHLINKADPSKREELPLPVQGTVNIVFADEDSEKIVLGMASWLTALKYFIYNDATKKLEATTLQPEGKYDAPADLESHEVLVKSHDGEMVPLSIIHKKGLVLDGTNPTWIAGYGAYSISSLPAFNPIRLAWYEKGGVFAVAHVRGGGEKGEAWYRGGYKATKPNTWKDFIACAEYLVANKYTSPQYLAGMGTSAGGILIGRAMTERPDLFAVAIPRVGCMNAVRFEFTENAVNTPEFGTVKDSLEFTYLAEMDAYQKLKPGVNYPACFVTAGMTDSRVSPWQPGKFAAKLQAVNKSERPMILRVEFEGGHGFLAASRKQIQEENADMMAFMLWQMGKATLL